MFKRCFDIAASLLGLLLLSPIIILLAFIVRRKLGSPVLFRQVRPGLNGAPFEMLKFRTMKDSVDSQGQPLPDSERMTPFGTFLRSSSLDELPGLWSVLKGDMSLVGPRPLLNEYLPLYSLEQRRRHDVKPGITGWAQINGRNAISWEQKFQYDVWYVDNRSLWLDLKIIVLTIKKVFVREGITASGEVTMSKFSGTIVLRKLAILGTGGHGKVVADTAEMCDWSNIEFFDDRWPSKTMLEHWPIKGDTQVLLSRLQEFEGVIVAIGNNSIRHSKINELLQAGANIISLSHPAAVISKYATIGRGVVVLAGVVVNASVKIGDGAILNTGCSVDHDCVLAECVHISPGARLAGEVDVGFLSWIGIGASVRQCVTIGSNVTVGAGAVIVGDTVDDVTLVGVPAKVFERTVFDDDLSRIS
ncbi:UDP-N-acetylgalactosaminyltransferase [Pseudomonas sp. FSL R10-2245]|nr:UDP-N-acetylgalactosaminyltransferase [Pseudomonas sp. FSL R10-2245]